MLTAIALLQLFNAAAPGIAELILLIRKTDGTIAIVPMLDEAGAQFKANLAQATDWLKAHGKSG